jgi:hypothetical protein
MDCRLRERKANLNKRKPKEGIMNSSRARTLTLHQRGRLLQARKWDAAHGAWREARNGYGTAPSPNGRNGRNGHRLQTAKTATVSKRFSIHEET